MRVTRIPPTDIVLFATLRCSAACENCCNGCSPQNGRSMTLDEMKRYVDMSLEAYPDTIRTFCLTGGECMLLGKDIDKIFRYAKSKGLRCAMVSNAFWATSYDKALRTLERLKRCGLTDASFSTGNDHNKFVLWQNVRNAAVAAARLGIVAELRIEDKYFNHEISKAISADPDVAECRKVGNLSISKSTWMNFDIRGKKTRNWKVPFRETDDKSPCTSLFREIIINPYGEVYACCGIGLCNIPQMRLGNVNQEPLKDIYERAFDDFLKVWLFAEGPEAILKYVHKKTGMKIKWYCDHHCDMCRTIFTDRDILPVIRDNFFDAAYLPLLTYESKAESLNESRRRKR